MMEYDFSLLATELNRAELLNNIIKDIDESKALIIPNGLRNNILWQLGHIISVQQGLIYGLSGLPMKVDTEFIQHFRKGSSPADWKRKYEFGAMKDLLLETMQAMKSDLPNGKFVQYKPFKIFSGVMLNNINDAIQQNMAHEMYHMGQITMLKNLII